LSIKIGDFKVPYQYIKRIVSIKATGSWQLATGSWRMAGSTLKVKSNSKKIIFLTIEGQMT